MAENEKRSNPSFEPDGERLTSESGKRDWQRLADSTPSDPEDDPKQQEPRRGDMSFRDGDPGSGAPE